MTTLYDLSAEFSSLIGMDAGEDEAFKEALDETLAAQGEMLDQKIEATIMVVRSFEADAEQCSAEAKRLNERAKRFKDRAEACKERVSLAMENCGKDRIKRAKFSITRVPGRDVAMISDHVLIPRDYCAVKESVTPDKKAILEALKAGRQVPGATLGKGKDSLRIS